MSTATDIIGWTNGHIVDDHLVRSGSLTSPDEALRSLGTLGVSRVVCLKAAGDEVDRERVLIASAGILFVHVPMASRGILGYGDISKVSAVLKLINGGDKTLVHCAKGSDRSSVVCACYRIAHGWDVDQAIKEGEGHGWAWYNTAQRRAVREWAKGVRP